MGEGRRAVDLERGAVSWAAGGVQLLAGEAVFAASPSG